jgi:serine/threonine-protein kinase
MLTGARLFEGETVSDMVAGVLARDPDWARLPDPARQLKPVLERCLVKDPRRRLRDIGDVRMEIERALSDDPSDTVVATNDADRRGMSRAAIAAIAAVALAVGAVGTWAVLRSPDAARASLRLSMALGPNQQLATWDNSTIAFSPDGASIVTPIVDDGRQVLASRRLDEPEFRTIDGTEGGAAPFFSPDGGWLGFIANGKLVKVDAEGGRPFVLGDQQGAGGASWGPDGHIVYAPIYSDGLFRISEQGGEAQRLTTPDRERGELGHWWPQHLPGGDRVLFTAFCTPVDTSRVRVVSLTTGEVRDVVDGGFYGRYVQTGHLLYVKGDRLYAVPFDVEKAMVTGRAVSVLDDVFGSHTGGYSMLDVSVDGTLAYSPRSVVEAPSELVWVDRQGLARQAVGERLRFNGAALSPDGRTLALSIVGDSQDLWTYSLDRGTLSRVTSAARTEFSPAWSPDGRTLYYVLDEPPFAVYTIPVDASTAGRPLWDDRPDLDAVLTDVSPNGRDLVYTLTESQTGLNLYVRPVDGSGPARAVRATAYGESYGTFSPDGRWLAYQSDETGRPEIYVEALVGPGKRFQISADGGIEPLWARGSGEIFYRHRDEVRVVATSTTGGEFEFEPPVTLFSLPWARTGNNARSFDVEADGGRVLMTRIPEAAAPRRIDIVTHWLDELERTMGDTGQ